MTDLAGPRKPTFTNRTVSIADEQDEQIDAIAGAQNVTYSAALRELIAIGLDVWGEP